MAERPNTTTAGIWRVPPTGSLEQGNGGYNGPDVLAVFGRRQAPTDKCDRCQAPCFSIISAKEFGRFALNSRNCNRIRESRSAIGVHPIGGKIALSIGSLRHAFSGVKRWNRTIDRVVAPHRPPVHFLLDRVHPEPESFSRLADGPRQASPSRNRREDQ